MRCQTLARMCPRQLRTHLPEPKYIPTLYKYEKCQVVVGSAALGGGAVRILDSTYPQHPTLTTSPKPNATQRNATQATGFLVPGLRICGRRRDTRPPPPPTNPTAPVLRIDVAPRQPCTASSLGSGPSGARALAARHSRLPDRLPRPFFRFQRSGSSSRGGSRPDATPTTTTRMNERKTLGKGTTPLPRRHLGPEATKKAPS